MSYCSFFQDHPVKKTQRPHRCAWCNDLVPKGSKTQKSVGVFEGDFFSDHMHMECYHGCLEYFRRGEDDYERQGMARGRPDNLRTQPPVFDELGNKI